MHKTIEFFCDSGGLGAGVIAVIVLIVISAVLVVLVLFVAKKNNLCCFKYKQVPVKEGVAGMLTTTQKLHGNTSSLG